MTGTISALEIACLATVVLAAFIDLRTNKVPNWLTFPAALLAVALQTAQSGWLGILWALEGWLVGAGVTLAAQLLPLLTKRYKAVPIGYGDTKLIAAVGAFLGGPRVLLVFFYFCLYSGALSLVQIAMVIPWRQISSLLQHPAGTSPPTIDLVKLNATLKSYISLAPAIALATFTTVFFAMPLLELPDFPR